MLPFNRGQFIAIFVEYNAAVWPVQVVACFVGLVVVAMLVRPSKISGATIGAALAAMWIWTGIVYHELYFSTINKAALAFGAFFVLQGIGLAYAGATHRLRPSQEPGWPEWLGWAFMAYAAVIYPVIGIATGHRVDELPVFGITPCPVTIFTLGVLLVARGSVPWWLLAIPFAWSLIGGSAAFLLDVPQDWLLLIAGITAVPGVLRNRRDSAQAIAAQPRARSV